MPYIQKSLKNKSKNAHFRHFWLKFGIFFDNLLRAISKYLFFRHKRLFQKPFFFLAMTKGNKMFILAIEHFLRCFSTSKKSKWMFSTFFSLLYTFFPFLYMLIFCFPIGKLMHFIPSAIVFIPLSK